MCTLVAAVGQFPGYPLVVAANRDERLDRAASPPRRWPGPVPFIAPKDEVAGGTWLGVNARGLFVGITNRFGVPVDPKRRSRGQIVVDALAAPSARELHERMARFPAAAFNPFHLLYTDGKDAFVTWYDGESRQQAELGRGLHVVTERSLGGDDKARSELIHDYWRGIDTAGPPPLEQLEGLLKLHGKDDPVGGTCVHVPAFNYGTRSSMLLLAAAKAAESRFIWAEGTPHEATFVDRSGLLRALL
jgi:uncharacterized protein with NRDE domain